MDVTAVTRMGVIDDASCAAGYMLGPNLQGMPSGTDKGPSKKKTIAAMDEGSGPDGTFKLW